MHDLIYFFVKSDLVPSMRKIKLHSPSAHLSISSDSCSQATTLLWPLLYEAGRLLLLLLLGATGCHGRLLGLACWQVIQRCGCSCQSLLYCFTHLLGVVQLVSMIIFQVTLTFWNILRPLVQKKPETNKTSITVPQIDVFEFIVLSN